MSIEFKISCGFKYKDQQILKQTVERLNKILFSYEFSKLVYDNAPFTYTSNSSSDIINRLTKWNYNKLFEIVPFYVPWYKRYMRKVRAYVYSSSQPYTIYLNASYPNRNIKSLSGTIMHEFCHLKGYSHGSNKPHGDKYYNSVPCKIGSLLSYFDIDQLTTDGVD
jgi:hypothetical protein